MPLGGNVALLRRQPRRQLLQLCLGRRSLLAQPAEKPCKQSLTLRSAGYPLGRGLDGPHQHRQRPASPLDVDHPLHLCAPPPPAGTELGNFGYGSGSLHVLLLQPAQDSVRRPDPLAL